MRQSHLRNSTPDFAWPGCRTGVPTIWLTSSRLTAPTRISSRQTLRCSSVDSPDRYRNSLKATGTSILSDALEYLDDKLCGAPNKRWDAASPPRHRTARRYDPGSRRLRRKRGGADGVNW